MFVIGITVFFLFLTVYLCVYGVRSIIFSHSLPRWVVKHRIRKRALAQNIILNSSFYEEAYDAVRMLLYQYSEGKIDQFLIYDTEAYFNGRTQKEALNACCDTKGQVQLSYKWFELYLLEYDDRDSMLQALKETLGHEIGHYRLDKAIWRKFQLKHDFKEKHLNPQRYKFLHYVMEVHADFWGCVLACDSNPKTFQNSCKFKQNYIDMDGGMTHPSALDRIRFVKMGTFDDAMIDLIAREVGFTDWEAIDFVKNVYRADYVSLMSD